MKDKSWKAEEKLAIRMLVLELAMLIVFAFKSLNPVSIITTAQLSMYKMLTMVTPYALNGKSLTGVNVCAMIAIVLILLSVIVIAAATVMIITKKMRGESFRLALALALILQVLALIFNVAEKNSASSKGLSNVALGTGFTVFVVFILILAFVTIKQFMLELEALREVAVEFFGELHHLWYVIVGCVSVGIMFILALLPFTNMLKFSDKQGVGNFISTITGGFVNSVIGLTKAQFGASQYNLFNLNGLHVYEQWKFEFAYYTALVLTIAVIVALAGFALGFVNRKFGGIIAFCGSVVAVISGVAFKIAATALSYHTKDYYRQKFNVDLTLKSAAPVGFILFLLFVMLFCALALALPTFKSIGKFFENHYGTAVDDKMYDSKNLTPSFIFGVILSGLLFATAYIPALNPLKVSGYQAEESLITTLGNKSKFLEIFKVGVENQYFKQSAVEMLFYSGWFIIIGAALVAVGCILRLLAGNGFVTKMVHAVGIVYTGIATFMYLSNFNTLASFKEYNQLLSDETKSMAVEYSTAAYRGIFKMGIGVGMIVFIVLVSLIMLNFGISFRGNLTIGTARIAAAFAAIGLFVPQLNPGRIVDGINKNAGLWTAIKGFEQFIQPVNQKTFENSYVDSGVLYADYAFSVIAFIAVVAVIVGFCMSFGELKFKKLSAKIMAWGSIVGLISVVGIAWIRSVAEEFVTFNKIVPLRPFGIFFYIMVFAMTLVFSLAAAIRLPAVTEKDKYEIKSEYKLFLMALPFIALVIVFSYLPLWGWRYSFYEYTVGQDLSFKHWVGGHYFKLLLGRAFYRKEMLRVLRNTLVMSGLGLSTQFLPVVFAIFISEIRAGWFRKIVQTFTTVPNFISWVLVYAIARAIFESDGFLNNLAISAGWYSEPKLYLQFSGFATCIWMLLFGIWKGLGWSAIIYIAAISGIDQQLYEAATVDGAGRFQRMWHITVPGLMPTFLVLFLMAVAGVLSNGLDQYYVFSTSANKEWIEVLDYYVYKVGLGDGSIAIATIFGMMKSIVSVVLLFAANTLAKVTRGESIV